jgi:hypothetical protein
MGKFNSCMKAKNGHFLKGRGTDRSRTVIVLREMAKAMPFMVLFLSLPSPVLGQVVWKEDFNGFDQDWVCCKADCAGEPGVPPGYSEFHSNTLCKNYGECNSQITIKAERSNPGVENKRGFRIYLKQHCFPTGENVLKKDLGENLTAFYLRWYERDSVNRFSHFQKLFRLKQKVGQILIPEWQVNRRSIQMNLGDAASGKNHFFPDYSLDWDYKPGTWVCYELRIDLVKKEAEFWVDGKSKGKMKNLPWRDGWYLRNIEIGGNQYGHSWKEPVEEYRDYDDIVVSKSYVGPGDTSGPKSEK